ncbi:hypothetical protein [Caenimonas soli]|uniref:hypothetical protein n=1 Tax=Caenimonas soli TaxID=2735555 RepID=UPI001557101F|nr:hypothetical protein [Caenimonas soli]NPC57782.1 hypothetical protein [Caenimonas soli]
MTKFIDMQRALSKAACLLMLAACNPVAPTAEAIASDPNRMRDLMRQCKVEWAKVGDATCTAASEAWRRHFFGKSDATKVPASSAQRPRSGEAVP